MSFFVVPFAHVASLAFRGTAGNPFSQPRAFLGFRIFRGGPTQGNESGCKAARIATIKYLGLLGTSKAKVHVG